MRLGKRKHKSPELGMEQALQQDIRHLQRMALLYKRRGLLEPAAAVYETLHELLEEAQPKVPAIGSTRDGAATSDYRAAEASSEAHFSQASNLEASNSGASNSDVTNSQDQPGGDPKQGGRFIRLIPND